MKQKTLSRWLRVALAGAALCGVFVYAFLIPSYGGSLAAEYPEFAYCYVPWLVFLLGTAVPIVVALVLAWLIAADIGKDRSFTLKNAKRLGRISVLAAVDSAYFFAGNVVLLLLSMSHPGIALFSVAGVLVGLAFTAVAAALSHLVRKGAALQEQSDLTI